MARKKNTEKKAVWKDLPLPEQLFTFLRGKDYSKSPETYDLAAEIMLSCDYTKKISFPEGFAARLAEWDGANVIKFMAVALDLIFECHAAQNGKKLHELADAITTIHKPIDKAADPEREWLSFYLYQMDIFSGKKYETEPRKPFSKIRDAFELKFPDSKIDDPTLRTLLKELEYECLPEKRGPKGSRIRH